MAVYRLKLFTPESGHDAKYKITCIEANQIAIGWPVKDAKDLENYWEKAQKIKDYCNDNNDIMMGLKVSLNRLINISDNIKNGIENYIWVQIDGLDYRLGKITNSEIIFDNKFGPMMKCELNDKRNKIDFDLVPGEIISRFVGRGYVLCQVHCSEEIEKYCKTLYENYKPEINANNIKNLLHYDDLEDLAGLYLQEKMNYYIIPSKNKQGSKLIEYELRDKFGNKACIQCKIGDSEVNVKKIREKYPHHKIYVCTLNEEIDNFSDSNAERIPIKEIFDWMKDHKNILPERIKKYIDLTVA